MLVIIVRIGVNKKCEHIGIYIFFYLNLLSIDLLQVTINMPMLSLLINLNGLQLLFRPLAIYSPKNVCPSLFDQCQMKHASSCDLRVCKLLKVIPPICNN